MIGRPPQRVAKVSVAMTATMSVGPQPDCPNRTMVVTVSGSNISCTPQIIRRTGLTSICFVSNACLLANVTDRHIGAS